MKVSSVLIGFVAGAGLTYVLVAWGHGIEIALSPRSTAAKLGADLMARVGAKFVHVSGSDRRGYFFYDQPKPIGHFLCRTNEYVIPTKVIAQREKRPQEFWEDNLRLERRYGVWRAPVSAPKSDLTREAACKSYRGFDRLISENQPFAAERGVLLMDKAGVLIRTGKATFPVSCTDQRAGQKPCDGLALLKNIDVKQITAVRSVLDEERSAERIARHTDEVSVAITPSQNDHPEDLIYSIRSIQRYGEHSIGDGDIASIDIRYEVY